MKIVYYTLEPFGVSTMILGDLFIFDSLPELEIECVQMFGADFELKEVNQSNWDELYQAGAFNE
ncbi:hypothetical protein [Ferrimonas futtsuensis]|uniref:hypothetical protein n=1 Tax=Ferrimonas futtsuensis TaxID=364764 RepID=UPI00146BDA69|nr:hypothetical protein [Ferrimonas futtsuensis]